ncbi:MAG: dTMP kinase [Candidatus Diapherotrites archaeon]|nr:dTMP kinase [Candidatus Diapherotrites archaeon]
MMDAPRFIVFEGIDGSGKTTQALLLHHWLSRRGYKVLLTEEPTRDLLTGYFVKILLRSKDRYPPITYLSLFLLDRLAHQEKEIKPALQEGKVVISDRHHFSTLAYQTAMGIEREVIDRLTDFIFQDFFWPDLVIYIDLPPEEAMKRVESRGKTSSELFEKIEFLRKVRENYLKLAEEYNFLVVDGQRNPVSIHEEIVKKLEPLFPPK